MIEPWLIAFGVIGWVLLIAYVVNLMRNLHD